jgi:hypothetical protein
MVRWIGTLSGRLEIIIKNVLFSVGHKLILDHYSILVEKIIKTDVEQR